MLVSTLLITPAFAISEAEVEAQINAAGKETVTGNVLIWFLCAIAFLKVSQKIDSFMASLGVNVGHTGGSMLAEAMIATRSVGAVIGGVGRGTGHRTGTGETGGSTASVAAGGFLKGGFAGVVSRKLTNDAVKTATSTTSAVQKATSASTAQQTVSAKKQVSQSSEMDAHGTLKQTMSHSGQLQASQTVDQYTKVRTSTTRQQAQYTANAASPKPASSFRGVGIGGTMFAKSLLTGGSFANDVIGQVARGDIRTTGSITGDMASQAMMSYMGITALGETATEKVSYSDVEIGGGRITGTEMSPAFPGGIEFGMYRADQYAKPEGDYKDVVTADGAKWYKQYAADTVIKAPFKAPDGEIDYSKEIVKRLPNPPKRKDRM